MLQFTDIILGATRDWFDTELQKRKNSVGKELSEMFFPKFHYGYKKAKKEVVGFGINFSNNSHKLIRDLRPIINQQLKL